MFKVRHTSYPSKRPRIQYEEVKKKKKQYEEAEINTLQP
jgi:hypothetical protein